MAQRIQEREWFYDSLVESINAFFQDTRDLYDTTLKWKSKKPAADIKELLDIRSEFCASQKDHIEFIKRAKPILVGPATLESLINQEPESYEYVREGKLPFDILFFEFAEPFKMELPFVSSESELFARGLLFYKAKERLKEQQAEAVEKQPSWSYAVRVYYGEADNIIELKVLFNPDDKAKFHINVLDTSIDIDMNTKILERQVYGPEILGKERETYIIDLSKPENDDAINHIQAISAFANLCTNLVNYVNAHNVTIVKRKREVELIKRKKGADRTLKIKRPYYLIIINDKIMEVDENASEEKHWTLTERIYVRGHDRRYRNDKGEIYRTSWIAPHIKGPPNAPWRNQRYQLLAEKLEREQRLFRETEK